eukprot:256156_1
MVTTRNLLMVICTLIVVQGNMSTFDCPMRELALQFAHHIQPHLSMQQLQEIADALNGSPESQNCDISPATVFSDIPKTRNPSILPDITANTIPIKIYVSDKDGSDITNSGLSLQSPFKTIQFALNKLIEYRNNSVSTKAMIILRAATYYLQSTLHITHLHSNLIITNYLDEQVTISGAIPLYNCSWKLYQTTSDDYNIYSVHLKHLMNDTTFDGLRVNGSRAIRARYPNANPSIDGFGSNLLALQWFPSLIPPFPDEEIYMTEYPIRNESATNEFVYYQSGIGGTCHHFSPPMGYWCGTKTQGGSAHPYQVPHGFIYNQSILPNTPYKNATNGIVSVWRPAHWATWFFKIGDYDADRMHINFSSGGYQGARGNVKGQEFYIENIFEELDSNHEWFYNDTEYTLYYYNNLTNKQKPICTDNLFEVTKLEVLLNVTGNQSFPVRNLTLHGITLQDAAYTEFAPHVMPSGGDWSIQRIGAITMEGAENINITNNLFTRNDGIAIILNRYNRNVTIEKNEFVWNGDTAIALVGDTVGFSFEGTSTTMGFDGTTGVQPRFIHIVSNYVHELGIFEKQSAFVFEAKSCQNHIKNNIFYNGPRAGINFNDGFGGGNNVESNLLFNTCRESGDHGPFNSWDRQVFVTRVHDGSISTRKAYDHISRNFMIGNYNTQDVIDTDDGSSYYKVFNNFLVYGPNGQKSTSGGHDLHAFGNIYAYIFVHKGWDWWGPTCFHDFTTQRSGHKNYYYNNTCVLGNGTMMNGQQPAVRIGYAKWIGCDDGGVDYNTSDYASWTVMHENSIYIQTQDIGLCNTTEIEFQETTHLDHGTVVYKELPSDENLLEQAKKLLWLPI